MSTEPFVRSAAFRILIVACLMLAGRGLFAEMPSAEMLEQAKPIVDELLADYKAKAPIEAGDAALKFIPQAETDAAKYLLAKNAMTSYSKAGNFDKAADAVLKLQKVLPELPPSAVMELITSTCKKAGKKNAPRLMELYRLAQTRDKAMQNIDSLKKKLASAPNDSLRKQLAETLVASGDWSGALEEFSKLPDTSRHAKNEIDGKDLLEAADFWWTYAPASKEKDADTFFKAHAAGIYKSLLADDAITGLKKTVVEKRLKTLDVPVAPLENAASKDRVVVGTAALPNMANMKPITIDVKGDKLKKRVQVEFMPCPAGSFEMGNSDDEESPCFRHKVTITRPFWMSKYQASCDLVAASNVKMCNPGKRAASKVFHVEVRELAAWLTKKYNKQLPKGYVIRLPSEAEWEYALNANDNDPNSPYVRYKNGDKSVAAEIMVTVNEIKELAKKNNWFEKKYCGAIESWKPGTKTPNAWGLYDMLGNQAEIVLDTFSDEEWTGSVCGGMDSLDGKEVLRYAKEETDPLRYFKPVGKGKEAFKHQTNLVRGSCKSFGGLWYHKDRMRSLEKYVWARTTFRLVIGPDLEAEAEKAQKQK